MNSMNFTALSLFGAFFASTRPEMFTWVPPPWKVGMSTFTASPHWRCSFVAVRIRPT